MKKNLAWNTIGSIFYSACQWVITIIVIHIADFDIAGYLSLAMTMSSSFSAISLFSMRNFQVSDVVGEFDTSQYVSSRIWTSIIAFVSCAIVANIGNSIFQALCIIAFMGIRVAEAIVDVCHGVNQKHGRYDLIGISYIIRGFVTVLSFTIILYTSNNLLATLFVMAILNLFFSILFDCRNTFNLESIMIDIKDTRIVNLLNKCFPLVIFTFLLSLENLIPKNVLQNIYGTEQLGIYSSISSPTLIVQVFASVIFNPFLPMFSEIYHSGDVKHFRKLLHKTYLLLGGLCFVVIIGALLLGRIGLSILFGNEILQYYFLFMPIIWCTLFTGIIWILSAIVILLRQIKVLLAVTVINFMICVLLVVPIVSNYGPNGVSIVQLISLPILILMMIVICEYTSYKKDMGEK